MKPRNLSQSEMAALAAQYGVNTTDSLQDYIVKNVPTLDFEGSVFFARELEHIKASSYDVISQDLYAREVFPVSTEAGSHVTHITYRSYSRVGMAKIINSYAQDLPRADVAGAEITIPVRPLGISFAYTLDEILASQATGRSLDQKRANNAQRGVEESIDRIAWFGDAENGLPGFLSNTNIPRGPVATGGGGDTWALKTADEILLDITNAIGNVFAVTRQKERPSKVMIPTLQWNLINTRPRSIHSDTTVLNYIVQNSPFISSAEDIMPIPELAGAGNAGEDVMVIYSPDPDKLQLEIPMELQFLAPQPKGLQIEVPGWAKIGGVNVYYPMSASIIEGI
jgi:hypothetical protein